MEHVKFRVNQRGPPRKAKYFWMTDSELVPWGKGENRTPEGEWKEHETINLQAVVERLKRLTACLLKNEPTTYN